MESITQTSGRSRSSVAHTTSRFVSARISTCSAPPSRAARSLTCAVDSSPVTRRARRSREIAASAISSSVDFPTPGSPPTRTSEAGTSPPPSTRSSSGTPVGIRSASSTSTSASRSSGLRLAVARSRRGGASSASVPKLAAARTAAEPAAGRVPAFGAGVVNGGSFRHAAESRSAARRRLCRNRDLMLGHGLERRRAAPPSGRGDQGGPARIMAAPTSWSGEGRSSIEQRREEDREQRLERQQHRRARRRAADRARQ